MGVTRVTTPLPGPNSRALAARQARVVTTGLSTFHPLFVASGAGATLTDVDGNVFLDFAGGIGVMNAGHAQPEIVRAIAESARQGAPA